MTTLRQQPRHAAMSTTSVVLIASGILIVSAVLGLGLGSRHIDPATVVTALTAYDPMQDEHLVIVQSRVPRIVLGIVVGAALGLAGALMQSITRNPLADPGILGVNAGASVLVVLAIGTFGVTHLSGYIWFAFIGAAAAAVVVYLLGSAHGRAATPARMALAGTAVSMVIGAITQMLLISNEPAFQTFRYWALGSLQGRDLSVVATILPFVLIGTALALLLSGPLNTIGLGEETAAALGTRVAAARAGTALAVVLLAGAGTAAAGPIAFIGLGAAHLARRFTGNEHRRLLPVSLLIGATLLVSADTLGRFIVAPSELQTGIAAALFGAPLFIMIVRSRRVAAL